MSLLGLSLGSTVNRKWYLLPAGVAAFLLVAAPWYLMVTVETRGEFARGFFLHNNLGRFLAPMEDHRGPFWYVNPRVRRGAARGGAP